MTLTPLQRKTLIRYNELRNRPVALAEIILKALPPLLVLGVLAGVAAFFVTPGLAYFMAGLGLGATLRQISIGRQTVRILPVILAVIDWSRVAALLGESAPSPTSETTTRAN